MNLTDTLNELNIPNITEGHHHCRAGWIQIDCPFCGKGTNKFHMGIPLNGKQTNCWRCGVHSLIDSLIEYTGLDYKYIKNIIKDLPQDPTTKNKIERTGRLILPKGINELQTPHIAYLKERGFKTEQLQKLWKIQGIGIAAINAWHIFIPILFENRIVSWTLRALSNNKETIRYIKAPVDHEEISHRILLYGEDYARHAIIIHEGPTDVWRTGPGAVATMGLNFSSAQVLRMSKYPTRVVCFDNEPVAQKKAQHLADVLSIYPGKTYNVQLDSKDAGCATTKEIRRLQKFLL